MSERNIREVTLLVAERRGLTGRQIYSATHAHAISHARHEVFYVLWSMTRERGGWRYTVPQIAAHFGMDHTTVLYGIQKHCERAGITYEGRQGGHASVLVKRARQKVQRLTKRQRADARWEAYCKAHGWPLEAA